MRLAGMPQRPDHIAFERGGHGDREHAALAIAASAAAGVTHWSHGERRRLAAVVLFRFDEVVRTERNLDRALAIEAGVPERQRDRAVGVCVEAVEERRHALAVRRHRRQRPMARHLRSRNCNRRRRYRDEETYKRSAAHRRPTAAGSAAARRWSWL